MKNKKVKQKKGARRRRMHCPYCGSPVIYRTADGIYKENTKRAMLFVCSRYPACNAYVRANKVTKKPIGTLADPSLRRLRNQAHRFFNRLYESGLMSKGEAYNWLSVLTGMPESMAHIGFMGEYNCRLIIDESKRLLKSQHISYWRGGNRYGTNRRAETAG